MKQKDLEKLRRIHGRGRCHVCGKLKYEKVGKSSICSYPHGMLPVKPVVKEHEDGFWEWK
jgi:hypothetical protein